VWAHSEQESSLTAVGHRCTDSLNDAVEATFVLLVTIKLTH
jgi:hypothetical protein